MHRYAPRGQARLDAAFARILVRILRGRALKLQGPEETPGEEEEVRDDLAGEPALGPAVEPGRGVALPGPRPGGERDLDGHTAHGPDGVVGHPVANLVDREGRREGEVHGHAGIAALHLVYERAGVVEIGRERLLAEHGSPGGKGAAGMAEMARGGRGDVDAVACRDEVVDRSDMG